MTADTRGAGFVQLNTPSAINYTGGQTLSIADLSRHLSRVECVRLPATFMASWRRGSKQYTRREGFQPFAADAEAERGGEGPILPALANAAAAAVSSSPKPFLSCRCSTRVSAEPTSTFACAAATPSASSQTATSTATAGATNAAASAIENAQACTLRGIHMVSHHKVSGVNGFVYPDYDGVLSSGVVPRVIVTTEEQAEREAVKGFYVSPLTMSAEELEAFEELQVLWKSRARSRSVLGAQHRAFARGAVAPGEDDHEGTMVAGGKDKESFTHGRDSSGVSSPTGKRRREVAANVDPDSPSARDVMLENEVVVDAATDDMLAEALRMADDLLQLN